MSVLLASALALGGEGESDTIRLDVLSVEEKRCRCAIGSLYAA